MQPDSEQAVTTQKHTELRRAEAIGQAANRAAARHSFADYLSRKSENTLRRQAADLALFADFLETVGIDADEMRQFAQAVAERSTPDPGAWLLVTWGIVEAFVKWQLQQGYAVGSINVRLSTIKSCARQAVKAHTMLESEYAMIRLVQGYSRKEAKRIDERRETVRRGAKKAEPAAISKLQAALLKAQPVETPQGRRDRLLLCLLLDHGLRVGEVALLRVEHFDLKAGTFEFYRPKVDKVQTHQMTDDTWTAARGYIEQDVPWDKGPLLRGSVRGGRLAGGMSERAVTDRVRVLGERIGLKGLSAHDCRHHWATQAARNGTPLDRLQDAGGWNSYAMPLRYVEAAAIANEGVRLEGENDDAPDPI